MTAIAIAKVAFLHGRPHRSREWVSWRGARALVLVWVPKMSEQLQRQVADHAPELHRRQQVSFACRGGLRREIVVKNDLQLF